MAALGLALRASPPFHATEFKQRDPGIVRMGACGTNAAPDLQSWLEKPRNLPPADGRGGRSTDW